jgi:hypothetical protein
MPLVNWVRARRYSQFEFPKKFKNPLATAVDPGAPRTSHFAASRAFPSKSSKNSKVAAPFDPAGSAASPANMRSFDVPAAGTAGTRTQTFESPAGFHVSK